MKAIAMGVLWGAVGAIIVFNLVNASIIPASLVTALVKNKVS